MLSKKNSMVTMVTDEFLENRIILQKSVATIGFIWFFWFQKCILLYIFAQVFLVMRSIRSHISLFRLGFTPTLTLPLNLPQRVCGVQMGLPVFITNHFCYLITNHFCKYLSPCPHPYFNFWVSVILYSNTKNKSVFFFSFFFLYKNSSGGVRSEIS